jgi:hypothetical protein
MDSDFIVSIIGLYPALNETRVVDSAASYGVCHHVVVRQYVCLSETPATGSVARDLFSIPASGLRGHGKGNNAVISKRQLLDRGDMSVCEVIHFFWC